MIIEYLVITLGLVLFEIISSIDNAVINAQVLKTVSHRARRWFLTWGLLFSVVAVRGLLPLLIVFISNPQLGVSGAVTAAFSSDPAISQAVTASKPVLLAGGGIYLFLLFLHWLCLENESFAFGFEKLIRLKFEPWFYALASVVLVVITWLAVHENAFIALGAAIGSSAFFITTDLKSSAEAKETSLLKTSARRSDLSKLLYLELLDATFSIDGVLGAFAFTTAVPLILIGNGIGAIIVREITLRGIKTVERLPFLTNGAMYSIAGLSCIMLAEALGVHVPFWITPLITVVVVGYFGWRSFKRPLRPSA